MALSCPHISIWIELEEPRSGVDKEVMGRDDKTSSTSHAYLSPKKISSDQSPSLLIIYLDNMIAELGLDRTDDLALLSLECGLLELRHHLPLAEPA
jgi:hypothetical protein